MVTMHYMATMYHVVTAHHSLQMYHMATMYHVTAVYKHICNISHGFVELLLLSGMQLTLKQHRFELQSPLRPKFFQEIQQSTVNVFSLLIFLSTFSFL